VRRGDRIVFGLAGVAVLDDSVEEVVMKMLLVFMVVASLVLVGCGEEPTPLPSPWIDPSEPYPRPQNTFYDLRDALRLDTDPTERWSVASCVRLEGLIEKGYEVAFIQPVGEKHYRLMVAHSLIRAPDGVLWTSLEVEQRNRCGE